MTIRKATMNDYIKVIRTIQNKHISYITPKHVLNDVTMNQLYIMVDDDTNKVVATLSLVWDPQYKYYALKRLCIPNNKNRGKGLAQKMLAFVADQATEKVGCTPWVDNGAMCHTLEKLGFQLEYIFEEKWCFYSKKC